MVTDTQMVEAHELDVPAFLLRDKDGKLIEAKEGTFVQDEKDIGGEPIEPVVEPTPSTPTLN